MQITITEDRKIQLSDSEIKEVAKEYLERIIDKNNTTTKVNGKLHLAHWSDTGHGSGMTDTHRKATKVDKAALLLLKDL